MDENLHNTDKIFTDTLRNKKYDLSDEVWNKIDAELNKDDRRISNRRHQKQIKNGIGTILLFMMVIAITTFQFRKDQPTAMTKLSGNQRLLDSNTSLSVKSLPIIQLASDETPNNGLLLTKKQRAFYLAIPQGQQIDFNSKILPVTTGQNITEGSLEMKSYHSAVSMEESEKSLHPIINADILSFGKSGNNLIVKHDKNNFKNKFSITPYFSQEFAGYDLTDYNDAYGTNGKEIDKKERNVFSASMGIYINYNFKKRWVLQSGISYSWSRSNIDSSTSYAVSDNNGQIQFKVNTVSGYGYLKPGSVTPPAIGDSVSTAKTYSELHYLTVPLLLSYNIPMKRFSLLVGGGVTVNMLTGASIETKTYGPGNPEKEYAVSMLGLKKVNMGIIVKADLEYHVSPAIGINLMPTFKNSVSPVSPESALTAYPYNFGIGLGFTYRF